MTEKNIDRITDIKTFKTNYIIDNVIVATAEYINIKTKGRDYWHSIGSEEKIYRPCTDIEDFVGCFNYDKLTPEGQKMLDEAKAKSEDNDD